jgi:hypothetical protein
MRSPSPQGGPNKIPRRNDLPSGPRAMMREDGGNDSGRGERRDRPRSLRDRMGGFANGSNNLGPNGPMNGPPPNMMMGPGGFIGTYGAHAWTHGHDGNGSVKHEPGSVSGGVDGAKSATAKHDVNDAGWDDAEYARNVRTNGTQRTEWTPNASQRPRPRTTARARTRAGRQRWSTRRWRSPSGSRMDQTLPYQLKYPRLRLHPHSHNHAPAETSS